MFSLHSGYVLSVFHIYGSLFSYLDYEQVYSQWSQFYDDLSLYGQLSGDVGGRQNRCRVRCSASKCKNASREEKMHQEAKKGLLRPTSSHFNLLLWDWSTEKIWKAIFGQRPSFAVACSEGGLYIGPPHFQCREEKDLLNSKMVAFFWILSTSLSSWLHIVFLFGDGH